MFYGTTTGNGSLGNDYPAPILAGAPVQFPRNGPTFGVPIHRIAAGAFVALFSGTYEISWTVTFNEPSQLQLAVNGVGVVNSTTMAAVALGINSNTVLATVVAGDQISIINPVGAVAPLTVHPADLILTHCQCPNVTIKLINLT